MIAIFWLSKGLQAFDASRVVPAIGGITPIFILIFIYVFSMGKEFVGGWDLVSLGLLIMGGLLISFEKTKTITFGSLRFSILAALFFAIFFSLSKYVYLSQPFLQGFIWIAIGGFLLSPLFLFFKEVRDGIFKPQISNSKKIAAVFLANQAAGAGANVLQSWAIALAPLAYVAVVNALQGIQYAFILMLTIFISLKFPQIFKEKISKELVFQKIAAILLIGGGLALLAL